MSSDANIRPAERLIVGGSVGSLLFCLVLTGCSSEAVMRPMIDLPSSVASSPTAAAQIAGDENSDGKLSAFESQVLAQNAPRDYALPDGSVVIVDPTQPLPAPVVQVIAEQAAPIVASMTSSDISVLGLGITNMKNLAESQATATGKGIVILYTHPGAQGVEWVTVASGLRSTGLRAESTREAMLPTVQSWAQSRGYELIAL